MFHFYGLMRFEDSDFCVCSSNKLILMIWVEVSLKSNVTKHSSWSFPFCDNSQRKEVGDPGCTPSLPTYLPTY